MAIPGVEVRNGEQAGADFPGLRLQPMARDVSGLVDWWRSVLERGRCNCMHVKGSLHVCGALCFRNWRSVWALVDVTHVTKRRSGWQLLRLL